MPRQKDRENITEHIEFINYIFESLEETTDKNTTLNATKRKFTPIYSFFNSFVQSIAINPPKTGLTERILAIQTIIITVFTSYIQVFLNHGFIFFRDPNLPFITF